MRYGPLSPSPDLHSDINRKLTTGRKSYFLQLRPGRERHCARAAFLIHVWDLLSYVYCRWCLMSPFSIKHNLKKWQARQTEASVCVLNEDCCYCLFLSPLKQPFPVPATDKPFCLFVFVLGWRSKLLVQTQGLWSVRVQGFICHFHPMILIASASQSDKSDWQAAEYYIYIGGP